MGHGRLGPATVACQTHNTFAQGAATVWRCTPSPFLRRLP